MMSRVFRSSAQRWKSCSAIDISSPSAARNTVFFCFFTLPRGFFVLSASEWNKSFSLLRSVWRVCIQGDRCIRLVGIYIVYRRNETAARAFKNVLINTAPRLTSSPRVTRKRSFSPFSNRFKSFLRRKSLLYRWFKVFLGDYQSGMKLIFGWKIRFHARGVLNRLFNNVFLPFEWIALQRRTIKDFWKLSRQTV